MAKNNKSIPLTEEQKIEILKRDAEGQSLIQIKKEMGIENGQQVSGALTSQYTPTGQYLLKKAGLEHPTRPPKKARKDLQPPDAGGESIREQLETAPPQVQPASQPGQVQPPVQLPASPGIPEGVANGSNQHLEPLRTLGPRPVVPSSAPAGVVGFRRDGTLDKYIVFRETPFKAQIGTFVPPWDVSELGPRFGDGDYRIERWIPNRAQPEIMNHAVAGYGPPRHYNYEGANSMQNQTPAEPPSAIGNVIVQAMKTGAELAKDQRPAPAPEPAMRPVQVALEKALEVQLEKSINPPPTPKNNMDEFFQNWMQVREAERKEERERKEVERREAEERYKRDREEREQQYKREKEEREQQSKREKEDRELEHRRRMEEQDKKHAQELERITKEGEERRKVEAEASTRREKMDREHEAEMQKLQNQKLDWAMKESNRAVEESNAAITQAEEKLAKKIDELNVTATREQERNRADLQKERDFLLKEIEAQKDQLKLHRDFQEQLIELKRLAASQQDNKLMELGEKILSVFNDRAKDVLEVQKARAVLENNPNLVGDAMRNNPGIAAKLAGGGGKPAGDKEMANRLEAAANTQEFHDFMEEWCMYVDEGQEAEVLFDSIQRRYQNNDAAVAELVDFMAGRKWLKAKGMIWPYLSPDQQRILSRSEAVDFYEKMRAMIVLMKSSAMKKWASWEASLVSQPPAPVPVETPEPAAEPTTEEAAQQ